MTDSIGSGRVGSKFSTCSGLGWVSQLMGWVGSGRVTQNGPMDNSGWTSSKSRFSNSLPLFVYNNASRLSHTTASADAVHNIAQLHACSYRVRGVDGSKCRAFNCRILYRHYLPTVILTIIWYSITHSLFHSRLKTFTRKSF